MTGNIVARRYAKALFAFAEKQGAAQLEAYGRELAQVAGVLAEAPDATRFFKSPVFSAEEKKAVLGRLLEKVAVSPAMKNFCDLLADKGRLPHLPDIAFVYGKLLDEKQGVVRGRLVTAVPLAEGKQGEIKSRLQAQAGRRLELEYGVDPEILGGVVLRVGDKVLDASLRAQLEMLKVTIKRGE